MHQHRDGLEALPLTLRPIATVLQLTQAWPVTGYGVPTKICMPLAAQPHFRGVPTTYKRSSFHSRVVHGELTSCACLPCASSAAVQNAASLRLRAPVQCCELFLIAGQCASCVFCSPRLAPSTCKPPLCRLPLLRLQRALLQKTSLQPAPLVCTPVENARVLCGRE